MLRRGLPIRDVFCVQAAIALFRLPLVGAWWWEGGVGSQGSSLLLSDRVFVVPPRCSEDSVPSRNWGRKPMQFAVWKEGLTSLPWIGGRRSSQLVWTGGNSDMSVRCLDTAERG